MFLQTVDQLRQVLHYFLQLRVLRLLALVARRALATRGDKRAGKRAADPLIP